MADGPISSRTSLAATGVTDAPDIRFGIDNLQGATPASNQMSLPELGKAIGSVINKDTVAAMLALTGVPDGTRVDTARYSTSHTVGDGSGGEYVYDADSTATIDGGFVLPGIGGSLSFSGTTFDGTAGTGRWLLKDTTVANVMQFGARTSAADNSTPIQNAINAAKEALNFVSGISSARYGGGTVVIPDGKFQYAATLMIDADVHLKGLGPDKAGALLHYTGTGNAIVINSTSTDWTTAPRNVRNFSADNVSLTAPSASIGWYIGAATERTVSFRNLQVYDVGGTGILAQAAVYTLGLSNVDIRECVDGLVTKHYCDLLDINDRCFFSLNTGYDIICESPTFSIANANFESGRGSTGFIHILQVDGEAENRNGMIFNCRFGPEEQGGESVDYDIVLSDNTTTNNTTDGLHLWANKHFSGVGATAKVAPLLIDSKIKNLDIRGNSFGSSYSSGFYATSTTPLNVLAANNFEANSVVDDIRIIDGNLKGAFDVQSQHHYETVVSNGALQQYRMVRLSGYSEQAGFQFPKVQLMLGSTAGAEYDKAFGLAIDAMATDSKPVVVATNGAVVTTTLDTTGSSKSDPVYLQANGSLGVTSPAGYPPFRVGRVMTVGTNAKVLVDIQSWGSRKQAADDIGNLGASATIDFNAGNGHGKYGVLTADTAITFAGTLPGEYWVKLTQNSTGGYNPTFPNIVNSPPTINATADAETLLRVVRDELGQFWCTAWAVDQINKDTVAAMLALTGVPDGTRVDTARYSTSHTVGDGSGGEYVYDADSTATIDGGFVMPGIGGVLSFDASNVFNGTAGAGRWLAKDTSVAVYQRFGRGASALKRTFDAAIAHSVVAEIRPCNDDLSSDWTTYTATGNLTVRGHGMGLVSLTGPGVAEDFIATTGDQSVDIENLKLVDFRYAVNLSGTTTGNLRVHKVDHSGGYVSVYYAPTASALGDIEVTRCVFHDHAATGIYHAGGVICRAQASHGNIRITDNVIRDLTGEDYSYGAYQTALITTTSDGQVEISRNSISNIVSTSADSADYHVGVMSMGANVLVADNRIEDIIPTDASANSYGIYTKASYSIVRGNRIKDCGKNQKASIECKGSERGTTDAGPHSYANIITDNVIRVTDLTTMVNAWGILALEGHETIIANNIVDGAYRGIYCLSEDNEALITGNRVRGAVDRGITAVDQSHVTISNNMISQFSPVSTDRNAIHLQANVACSDWLITGNSVVDTQGTANSRAGVYLAVNANVDRVNITNNNFGANLVFALRAVVTAGALTDAQFTDNSVAAGVTVLSNNTGYEKVVVSHMGTGVPNIYGSAGSTFRRRDGGTGTSFYVKESGTTNTGWVAK